MDANRTRFWMLADVFRVGGSGAQSRDFADWAYAADPSHLDFDADRRVLRLASERADAGAPGAGVTVGDAEALLARVPQTRDEQGTWARWREDIGRIVAGGALDGEVEIHAPAGAAPTDLAVGRHGILYIVEGPGVVLRDLRRRWRPVTITAPEITPFRLGPDPSGGVWVLDRVHRRLGRLSGTPSPDRPASPHRPDAFRPDPENPDAPRLVQWPGIEWGPDEDPVAIAVGESGPVILAWGPEGEARLRRPDDQGRLSEATVLRGARFGYSIAFLARDRLAVLVPGLTAEALVYSLAEWPSSAAAVGDLHPLRGWNGEPFVHGLSIPPHYPTPRGHAPLSPVSFPSFSRRGEVRSQRLIDSGDPQTVWHRLYLEAAIPPACGVRVLLAATPDNVRPSAASADWHEHRFGSVPHSNGTAAVPTGAWTSLPSEVPFHQGFLSCSREPQRRGLFSVLIQRAGRRVRVLRGRYLWVRMVLHGDGHATPEVAALRAYAPRFSYVQRYLPELYHESVAGADADEPVPSLAHSGATNADFLERFVANIEGMLTPIEDRIASAYLLTDPRTAPEGALEWLGSWIGLAFDPALTAERRRAMLVAAPRLYRWRGTLRGLRGAIDAATGGFCRRGEAVVVEDFRLRRTFATILGADFADEADPLLAGFAVSGNSYVGDTLFLGEPLRRELLALFGAEDLAASERTEVRGFFGRLANRVTVLVHATQAPREVALVSRVVALEAPAHLAVGVAPARYPFLVGIAALVGADTYLQAERPERPVRVDESAIGVEDFIQRIPSLDPRLGGERA